MNEKVPTPDRDTHGLPLCSQERCALFDGKRCGALGYRPDRFCEPALIETRDALLHLANAFAVAPDLTPTQMGVRIFEAVAAKLRESSDTADALRQEIVALRMAKLEVITAAQDLAKEAEREKLKLTNLHGYNMRLMSLLRDCPFGHANGQIIWHRSTTTADLVGWVEEVHQEARRPAGGVDGSPETATGTIDDQVHAEGGAAGVPEAPPESTEGGEPPVKLPPGWFLLETMIPANPSEIIPRIKRGHALRVQVSQVSSVAASIHFGMTCVTLSSGVTCFVLGTPDSLMHALWRARAQPKTCPKCGMGISAAFPECWCSP